MVARLCKEDRLLLQEIRNGMVAEDSNLLLTGMCNTNKQIWDARDEILEELQEIKQFLEELQGLKASVCRLARGAVPVRVDWANGFEPCCREPVARPQCKNKCTPQITNERIFGEIEEQEEPLATETPAPCNKQLAAEPDNEERSAKPQQPRQQDEWPDFEPEEVEEWPIEPQCHKPVAKTKADEMGMAGAQQDEVTKIMPQQGELPTVEPQQPRQQNEWPDFEPEVVEEWPVEPRCHEPIATPKQEETSMAGARQQEMATRMLRQEEINCVEPQLCQNLATNAKQVEWRPCVTIEKQYDDLSDLSSVDGNESPPHKQVKEYAAARRAARKQVVVGTSTVEPTEVGDGPARPIAPTEPKPTEQMPTQMTNLSAELVPCARQEAETATYIRQTLRQKLGNEAAEAILAQCQQKVVRSHTGKLQRYWVDATGATLRLAPQKNVTP
jgi:hypothetical protein